MPRPKSLFSFRISTEAQSFVTVLAKFYQPHIKFYFSAPNPKRIYKFQFIYGDSAMKKRSMRFKLFSILLASVALLCGGLVFMSSTRLKSTELSFAKEKLSGSASFAADYIESRMNTALNLVRNEYVWVINSTKPDSKIKMDEQSLSYIFKNILEENKEVLGLWLEWEIDFFANSAWKYTREQGTKEHRRYMTYWTRNAKGEISTGADSSTSEEGTDQSYYLIPFESKKEQALDPYLYPVDGVEILMTSLTIPMVKEGKVVGVAGVDIDMAAIQKMADSIEFFDGQGRVAIVTSNGVVAGWTKNSSSVAKTFEGMDKAAFKNFISDIEKQYKETGLATYKDDFVIIRDVIIGQVENHWYSIAFVPKSYIMAPIYKALFWQIGLSVVFSAIMLGLIMLFVNKFASRLMTTTGELVHLSETNKSVSEKVKMASTIVSEGNSDNSSAVHETVASLDEISSMIQANSEKAQQSDSSVKETVSQAQAGFSDMEEVAHSMEDILNMSQEMVSEFEKNAGELKSIVEMIRDIDNKTKVINEIVFQTKLLSFNASVEAARAGEYGKGFSVVAEEVGNLAQMSGRSAKEITDILSGSSQRISDIIERSISSIRTLTEQTKEKAHSGDQLAKKCQQSLSAVLNTANELQSLITQIAQASKEQAEGVNNISTAMHLINSTSAKNKNASEEALHCANDLLANSATLYGLAQSIKTEVMGSEENSAMEASYTTPALQEPIAPKIVSETPTADEFTKKAG